ncbi:MAG: 23S rRNA (adenine(2030)-N(6))-methyltransferase RlmJ [Pseudomonadota bacterium]
MLSYQHGFHAGNRADVLKHAVLDGLLRHVTEAGGPVLHVETHAGRGVYDLKGAQAAKTGEAADGVIALMDGNRPRPLRPWLSLVETQGVGAYPGSPQLARLVLGDRGRLALFEKHPAEYEALTGAFEGDRSVQIRKMDGYGGALKLKPRAKETLIVFSDPSYETIKDMDELAEWTPRALNRWPDALVVLWLPLFKDEREAAFGAYLSELEDGVIAGARWPSPDGRDTALSGSAIVAYRVPKAVRDMATSIASTLNSVWSS